MTRRGWKLFVYFVKWQTRWLGHFGSHQCNYTRVSYLQENQMDKSASCTAAGSFGIMGSEGIDKLCRENQTGAEHVYILYWLVHDEDRLVGAKYRDTLHQCRVDVGPSSSTLAQLQPSIGSTSRGITDCGWWLGGAGGVTMRWRLHVCVLIDPAGPRLNSSVRPPGLPVW